MKFAVVMILGVLGVALSDIILMEEGKSRGLGAISGMADTYWGKNKGRSIEGGLEKFTKIAAVLFFVVALVLDVIW